MPEMNQVGLGFIRSATGRLVMTYLAIIMLMSISFSIVFFKTSSGQLGRQLPPASLYENNPSMARTFPENRRSDFDAFFRARISEGRHELLVRLIGLNILVFVVGGILCFALARKTLEPIEESIEAQTRFVSDASHELRTPITALQTTNEVALRKKNLSLVEAKDLLQYNVAEAVKLKQLSDGLLGLIKQDRTTIVLSPASLQDIVGSAMNQVIAPAIAKQITIEDKVPNLTVKVDETAVVQVVTILLDNAIKYSPAKSSIILSARKKTGVVLLSVVDKGTGIPATDLPHIFERFFRSDQSRSKEQREGYGLGLSIAQKIMKQHGSDIGVKSAPGRGSTFTIKLSL